MDRRNRVAPEYDTRYDPQQLYTGNAECDRRYAPRQFNPSNAEGDTRYDPRQFNTDNAYDQSRYAGGNTVYDYSRHNSSDYRVRPTGPQPKVPVYDGREDIDLFLIPFERMAESYQWSDLDRIDRLFQCLRGDAMRYMCTLTKEVTNNYRLLTGHLMKRFGQKDPASTVRRKLLDLRQRQSESNEKFAEEVRRLTVRAYPRVDDTMLEELAAEAFLRGFRNSKHAYEAMNRNPTTLNEALEIVTALEHNYKATMARDSRDSTRRVTWEAESDKQFSNEHDVRRINPQPTYVTMNEMNGRITNVENMMEKMMKSQEKKTETACFNCKVTGNFARDCPHPDKRNSNEATGGASYRNGGYRNSLKDNYKCPRNNNEVSYARRRTRSSSPRMFPNSRRLEQVEQEVEQEDITDDENSPEQRPQSLRQIKITQTQKNESNGGIHVPLKVNDLATTAVIDTGADATVISIQTAKRAGISFGDNICKLLNAEENIEMEAFGGVTATLQIAKEKMTWPIYVAPIRDDVLIGLDFMQATDMTVLARQGDITVNGELVLGQKFRDESVSVEAAEDVMIKPRSEQVVIGRVALTRKHGNSAVIYPSRLSNGLHIGPVLVESAATIPVRVVNVRDTQILVSKDTHLGKLNPTVGNPEGKQKQKNIYDTHARPPETCNETDENSLRIPPGKATENQHVSGSRPPLANDTDENSQRNSSGGLSKPDPSSETTGTSGYVDRNSLRIPSPQSHSTRTRSGRPVVPPGRYDL